MLDIRLRRLKDRTFDPLCYYIPVSITPLHITALAFIAGLVCCLSAASSAPTTSLILWLLNRAFDCLDGALARQRNQSSDLGGFLDLLGDFLIYGLIPIACAYPRFSEDGSMGLALAVAFVLHSFFVNNFVLFFIAAVLEKRKAAGSNSNIKELTSLAMRPALIEGAESGVLFTIMLTFPQYTQALCWVMTVLVFFGTAQRVYWVAPELREKR